jgi:RelB antitoxin of RelBE toxin-antitoxin system
LLEPWRSALREIKKRYVVDEDDRRVAVQLDLETFEKIEEVLENYALFKLIADNTEEEVLDLNAAKKYYADLDKAE